MVIKHVYNGVLESSGTATNKALNAITASGAVSATQAINQLTTIDSSGAAVAVQLPTATDIVVSQNASDGDIFKMEVIAIVVGNNITFTANTGTTLGYATSTLATVGRHVISLRVVSASTPAVVAYT